MICLSYWLATAAICAWAVHRMTRSVAAAMGCLLVVFVHLTHPMVWEPGHPQEICVLLAATAILLPTWGTAARRTGAVTIGLGVVGGCLAMTKFNLGVFYMMALGMTLLALGPRNRATPVLTAVYIAFLLAAPTALMRPLLSATWCWQFDMRVTLALLAAVILCYASPRPVVFSVRHWGLATAAFLVAILVNLLAVWVLGSSPGYILYSNFLMGIQLGTSFSLPAPEVARRWLLLPVMAMAAAVVVTQRRFAPALAAFRIAGGLALTAAAWNWKTDYLYFLGPPLACLVLVGQVGRERSTAETFAHLPGISGGDRDVVGVPGVGQPARLCDYAQCGRGGR